MSYSRSVILLCVLVHVAKFECDIPPLSFEALETGGFRVLLPVEPKTTGVEFNGNINQDIKLKQPGSLTAKTTTPQNGYWILEFNHKLQMRDTVHYWMSIQCQFLGYIKEGKDTIDRFVKSYSIVTAQCPTAATVINNGQNTCVGDVIINDDFNGASIDTNIWTVEHRIPTYVEPDFHFNSYENIGETRFIRGQMLHLKPIANKQVRGELNLRHGCTATKDIECFFKSRASFLLPPVKSAKIVSKTAFKYGTIEIRAKLPQGDWIVPIIQLESKNKGGSHSSNIWIAYSIGNKMFVKNNLLNTNGERIGARLLQAGPILTEKEPERSKALYEKYEIKPYYDDFHTYGMKWTPDKMEFFVDSVKYGEVDAINLPYRFHQEFVVSLGVEVGGLNDFSESLNSNSGINAKPWNDEDVNYIKRFYVDQSKWLATWHDDTCPLVVDYVKVTSI